MLLQTVQQSHFSFPHSDNYLHILASKMKDQKQDTYWQETGRWAGYEESLDPQSGVWASSHISYLTFKSLIQLRRTMNTGQWRAEREGQKKSN